MITRRRMLQLPFLAFGLAIPPVVLSPDRVIGLGDSITAWDGNHASRVAAALRRPYLDLGLSGYVLAQMESTWRSSPDGDAIALVGVNDVYYHGDDPDHRAGFITLLTDLCIDRMQRGKLWIGGCIPMSGYPTANYRTVIAEVAHQTGATYVDLSWYDPTVFSKADGIHPHEGGQVALAAAFLAAMVGMGVQWKVNFPMVGV